MLCWVRFKGNVKDEKKGYVFFPRINTTLLLHIDSVWYCSLVSLDKSGSVFYKKNNKKTVYF